MLSKTDAEQLNKSTEMQRAQQVHFLMGGAHSLLRIAAEATEELRVKTSPALIEVAARAARRASLAMDQASDMASFIPAKDGG